MDTKQSYAVKSDKIKEIIEKPILKKNYKFETEMLQSIKLDAKYSVLLYLL